MGCFSACFVIPKHKKRLQSLAVDQNHHVCEALKPIESTNQEISEDTTNNNADSTAKLEEHFGKKKVTFDLNFASSENLTTERNIVDSVETETNLEKKNTVVKEQESQGGEGDLGNDNDDHRVLVQEESSESSSLFSLSIDSRKPVFAAEIGENEVNSPIMNRISARKINDCPNLRLLGLLPINTLSGNRREHVHSVLKPVENLAQWKEVKAKVKPPNSKYQSKENINVDEEFIIPISSEPSMKPLAGNSRPKAIRQSRKDQEIAVDTSLSSWLVESEITPMKKTRTSSVGNSPSEGAISPSSHEDNNPIIGSIGSYWMCTGQAMDLDTGISCKNLPSTTGSESEVLEKLEGGVA